MSDNSVGPTEHHSAQDSRPARWPDLCSAVVSAPAVYVTIGRRWYARTDLRQERRADRCTSTLVIDSVEGAHHGFASPELQQGSQPQVGREVGQTQATRKAKHDRAIRRAAVVVDPLGCLTTYKYDIDGYLSTRQEPRLGAKISREARDRNSTRRDCGPANLYAAEPDDGARHLARPSGKRFGCR